jgi:hypothetical protein
MPPNQCRKRLCVALPREAIQQLTVGSRSKLWGTGKPPDVAHESTG